MRTSIVSVLVLAACGGGGRGPTGPSNTGGTPVAASGDPWAALTKGAVFTVTNSSDTQPDGFTVTATVTGIDTPTADTRVIHLAWSENGAPMPAGGLPETVTVGASTVTFEGQAYPLATSGILPDGRYVDLDADKVCYGEGPAPGDETPCEDICFAELCVHPTLGIVGGAGLWWPNYDLFHR